MHELCAGPSLRAARSVGKSGDVGKRSENKRRISGGGARGISDPQWSRLTSEVRGAPDADARRDALRVVSLLACEQLAGLAGLAGSFDLATGRPSVRGQFWRHRFTRRQHFATVDQYVAWRLSWEVWTGTRVSNGSVLVPIVGSLSYASLQPETRAVLSRVFDVLHLAGLDSSAGVPL